MTAVFLRFESLPEAPFPFLRGLNKASRSSRFLDVETEGTSKSARSTAQLQRSRRRMRSPMVETPSLVNSLSEAEITLQGSIFSASNLSTRVPKFNSRSILMTESTRR